MYAGVCGGSTDPAFPGLNPASNDNGFLVQATPTPSSTVRLLAGFLFCDGICVHNPADPASTAFTTFTLGTPAYNGHDVLWVSLSETDVTDPALITQVGETTRRAQLQVTVGVTPNSSKTAVVAFNAGQPEIFKGGLKYFPIALITRRSGDAVVHPADITDLRNPLVSTALGFLTNGDPSIRIGEWAPASTYGVSNPTLYQKLASISGVSVGDGTNSFGDFTGPTALASALTYISAVATATPTHKTFKILVKEGTHEINVDNLHLPNYASVEFVGESGGAMPAGSTATGGPTVNISAGSLGGGASSAQLSFKNLHVTGTVAGFYSPVVYTSRILAENCTFRQIQIELMTSIGHNDGGILANNLPPSPISALFRNCSLFTPTVNDTTPERPFLQITNSSQASASLLGKIIFDNCEINFWGDAVFVGFGGSSNLGRAYSVESVTFTNCFGVYGKASLDFTHYTTAGIIGLNRSDIGAYLPSIEFIEFDKCKFVSDPTIHGAYPNAIFLHWVPVQYFAGATWQTGTSYVKAKVKTWRFTDCDIFSLGAPYTTTVGPFVLVSDNSRIEMTNVNAGFKSFETSGIQSVIGNTTNFPLPWLAGLSSLSASNNIIPGGYMLLAATIVEVNGLTLDGMPVYGTDPILMYVPIAGGLYVVDGVNTAKSSWKNVTFNVGKALLDPNGSTTVLSGIPVTGVRPAYYWCLVGGPYSHETIPLKTTIDGLTFNLLGKGTTQSMPSSAFVLTEIGGNFGLEGSAIKNVTFNGAANYLDGASTATQTYAFSFSSVGVGPLAANIAIDNVTLPPVPGFKFSTNGSLALSMQNCKLNTASGGGATGANGSWVTITCTSTTDPIKQLSFRGNTFGKCYLEGIKITKSGSGLVWGDGSSISLLDNVFANIDCQHYGGAIIQRAVSLLANLGAPYLDISAFGNRGYNTGDPLYHPAFYIDMPSGSSSLLGWVDGAISGFVAGIRGLEAAFPSVIITGGVYTRNFPSSPAYWETLHNSLRANIVVH